MHLTFASPSDAAFEQIRKYIRLFELDNRDLKKEEFCAAFSTTQLLGFGRLRNHIDCIELCSLGVVESHRHLGIGTELTKALIDRAQSSIYLVCIIPEFFTPLGFHQVQEYPASIQQKLDYCTQSLPVPETYVVMKWTRASV